MIASSVKCCRSVNLETFYANVNKWTTLTFDYQFFINPTYNADRGPVSHAHMPSSSLARASAIAS
jgi:hypothetical protein